MQFHETIMGHNHLTHTMPSIERSLNKIAEALSQDKEYVFSKSEKVMLFNAISELKNISTCVRGGDFHLTRNGRRFYEMIMPSIERILRQLACSARVPKESKQLSDDHLRQLVKDGKRAEGVVGVYLPDIINITCGLPELDELLSEALTGSKDALENLEYEVVGVDPDNKNFIIFHISGDVATYITKEGL